MLPAGGNFAIAKAQLAGDEKDLGVETEAFNGLQREDRLGGFPREELEAALGIGDVQAHDQPHQQVHAAPAEFSQQALPRFDQATVNGTGRDGDGTVPFLAGLEETIEFLDGRRKVGV